jgi:hypothetical protein
MGTRYTGDARKMKKIQEDEAVIKKWVETDEKG